MPILVSPIFNVTVNGRYTPVTTRPRLFLPSPRVGETAGIIRGAYSEGTGVFEQRWRTDLGVIDGATGLSFLIGEDLVDRMFWFEERTFNIFGYALPWVESDRMLIEPAEAVPGGEWVIEDTTVSDTPDGPTVVWSVNGSTVDYEAVA